MLLPLTKICRVKNKLYFLSNWHSRKIWRYHLQEQHHMVGVIRASKPSTQRISITIRVYKYYVDNIYHHKYNWNAIHSKWTRYMIIILSTTYLGQMKTAVTRNSRNCLLCQNHLIKPPPKSIFPNWRVKPLIKSM